MPEHVRFLPRKEILTFEEIERVVGLFAAMGISKLRLTGGEPLVRRDLGNLVRRLKSVAGITEVALTTNGVLLSEQALDLKHAGLDRINVSLDSLSEEMYQQITRRSGIDKVLNGIATAQQLGFDDIRLNAVAIRGLSEGSVLPLARFSLENDLHLRFIEFMPLDGDQNWNNELVLSGTEILDMISKEFGDATPLTPSDISQPATDFQFPGGNRVGFINSVSQPFCKNCNRLRITAEGKMRNCLFSSVDFDLRDLLRSNASDESIRSEMLRCVSLKKSGHGINSDEFERPDRAMYQIGG